MTQKIYLTGTIPDKLAHNRIDQALAKLFPDYSRARLSLWIKNQCVTVNEKILRPKDKVQGGEKVVIDALLENESWEAESIPLNIIYEDDALLVINKPAGLVVHPAMVAILFSLGSGLFFLVRDMGKGTRVVKALTIRIAVSLTLFILLIVAFAMGWIHPHPLG